MAPDSQLCSTLEHSAKYFCRSQSNGTSTAIVRGFFFIFADHEYFVTARVSGCQDQHDGCPSPHFYSLC